MSKDTYFRYVIILSRVTTNEGDSENLGSFVVVNRRVPRAFSTALPEIIKEIGCKAREVSVRHVTKVTDGLIVLISTPKGVYRVNVAKAGRAHQGFAAITTPFTPVPQPVSGFSNAAL